jgi:hypothetical protein
MGVHLHGRHTDTHRQQPDQPPKMRPPYPGQAQKTRPVPKARKMRIREGTGRILGSYPKGGTIQMDPSKIKGVADWPRPNNVRDVRAFLGFTGFYRYFIPNYLKIARPLVELTKKATPFHWQLNQ